MVNPSSPSTPVHYSSGFSSAPVGITTGPDGKVWFTEPSAGMIGTLQPSNPTQPQEFTLPSGSSATSLTTGMDNKGNHVIWYTDPGTTSTPVDKLGSISTSGTLSTEINIPQGYLGIVTTAGWASQMIADKSGTLWFTEFTFDTVNQAVKGAIGSYNPATGAFTETLLPAGQQPFGITLGPDGNIWFSEAVPYVGSQSSGYQSSAIGMINPTSPTTIAGEYTIPASSGGVTRLPYGLTAGPDGNIWFSDNIASAVGNINVGTHAVTTTDIPQATSLAAIPVGIAAGPDGNVWVVDETGAIDRATLDTNLFVAQSPSNLTTGMPFGLTATLRYTGTNATDVSYVGNATISLNGSPGTLGGTTSVSVVHGVASFTNLVVNTAGSGYSLTVSAGSLSPVTTDTFSVQNPALRVWSQPTGSLDPGGPFTVIVYTTTPAGAFDASFSGDVTVQLASNPGGSTLGGTTTVQASGGIAVFSGLSLNNPGTGYIVSASGTGLVSVATSPFNISAPAPMVSSATVLVSQKTNPRTHRRVGRPVLQGYQFSFNAPMSASIASPASYQVDAYVKARVRVKIGKRVQVRTQLVLKPIGFSVNMLSGNTVQILTGKQTFALGGQITLLAAGITSTGGGLLDGNGAGTGGVNGVYAIGPRGMSIRYSG